MSGWLQRLRDRQVSVRERARALATAAAVCAAALTLTLATHHLQRERTHPRRTPDQPAVPATAQPRVSAASPVVLSPQVRRAAQAFLAGYLAYLYGHAPAGRITDATPRLLAQLKAFAPRVSPGMQALQPRLLSLQALPARPGLVALEATVNDGGTVDYPVRLLLEHDTPRPLVTAIAQEP